MQQLGLLVAFFHRTESSWDAKMLTSAFTLAFFGLLRVSVYTCPTVNTIDARYQLSAREVELDDRRGVARVTIKASKTDPFRRGATVRVGLTLTAICPVTALSQYLQVRTRGRGPLYVFQNGRYLTRSHVSRALQWTLGWELPQTLTPFGLGGVLFSGE